MFVAAPRAFIPTAAFTASSSHVKEGSAAAQPREVLSALALPLAEQRRGEQRRVELPSGAVGFESSNWQPAPASRRGKATIVAYRRGTTPVVTQSSPSWIMPRRRQRAPLLHARRLS